MDCIASALVEVYVIAIVIAISEKPPVSAFQNFNWIENQLNIKKVMSKNVCVLCINSVNID